MIITSPALRSLNKGWRTLFFENYHGGTTLSQGPSLVEQLCTPTTSMTAEEFYGWLGAIPGLRELLGEVVIRNLVDHNYKIPNRIFEATIGVERVHIERDQFGIYRMLFTGMGVSARNHPTELLAEAMVNGFTRTCYTGKNFFDLNHEPQAGKVKFSNKGTKKLSVANYEAARAAIKSVLNAEGKPMCLGLDLVLVVSPQNESLGRSIVVSEKVGGGNDNVNKGTARLVSWPYLAATPDMWFLFEAGAPLKPFINQEEVALQLNSLTDLNSETVMLQQKFLHQAYRRGNVGYGLPELAWGSTGADAA